MLAIGVAPRGGPSPPFPRWCRTFCRCRGAQGIDLRISIDTKAKVKIGAFSRHGWARAAAALQAADHDMDPAAVLAPAGILEVLQDQLHIVFGTSRDTSDFVADALQLGWTNRQAAYPRVRRLLIDLDNGPEINSSRTQFMKRMVEFSDQHQRTLELAYYPPLRETHRISPHTWARFCITPIACGSAAG
jgi:hypothetical protein